MTDENERALLRELVRDEGLRLKPYRCTAGKLTIGVGRNLEDRGITAEEADFLLLNDVKRFSAELDERLPWWKDLDPVRRRVILNMAFNLGVDGLLGFKSTLAAVKAKDWSKASAGMLSSKWASQVGLRADRLAKMMRTGQT